MNTRKNILLAIIFVLAIIAGFTGAALFTQIHDAQSVRYELEATFEAQFNMEAGQ